MENQLYKYEFTEDVVQYLLASVEARQVRGEDQAVSLIHVKGLLRNPVNAAEILKAQEEAKKKEEVEAEKEVEKKEEKPVPKEGK